MDRKIKKILLFSFIIFALSTLCISVNAVTIKETPNTNDNYDTIREGSIIIGTTKFSPETIITAKKAAIAGANDMKVFVANGGDLNDYTEPEIYYYIGTNDWFKIKENGEVEPINPINSLTLYYIDNEPKTGIDSVTKEEIKIAKKDEETQEEIHVVTHTVTFMNGSSTYGNIQHIENGKKVTQPTTNPSVVGKKFIGWYKDGKKFDFSTSITADIVLTAEFESIKYKIVKNATTNGSITVTPKEEAEAGDIVGIAVYPNNGYTISSLQVKDEKGNNITINADNTFKMPTSNVTITANFKKYNSLKINLGKNGTAISKANNLVLGDNNEYLILPGEKVTLTISPSDGYTLRQSKFSVKKINGENITLINNGTSFIMPESNVIINIEFIKKAEVIDKENDIKIENNVLQTINNISNGTDKNTLDISYDKKNNIIEVLINKENENTLKAVSYTKKYADLIVEIVKDMKTLTYKSNNINLENKSYEELKTEFSKILLDISNKTIPATSSEIIDEARKITISEIKDKEVLIKADYDSDKKIDYTIILKTKTKQQLINESQLLDIEANFEDPNNNALEMQYNNENETIKFVIDSQNNTAKVNDYRSTLWDVVDSISDNAQTISFKINNGTPEEVNISADGKTGAMRKIIYAILEAKDKPKTDDAAFELKLYELIGMKIDITMNYGNNGQLNYSLNFISK